MFEHVPARHSRLRRTEANTRPLKNRTTPTVATGRVVRSRRLDFDPRADDGLRQRIVFAHSKHDIDDAIVMEDSNLYSASTLRSDFKPR